VRGAPDGQLTGRNDITIPDRVMSLKESESPTKKRGCRRGSHLNNDLEEKEVITWYTTR
jgi:hypothetical protein